MRSPWTRPGSRPRRYVGRAAVRRVAAVLMPAVVLSGCATVDTTPRDVRIEGLLAERGAPRPGWARDGGVEGDTHARPWLDRPMTVELAVRTAMLRSPRLQRIYGDLGLDRADVLEATQVANPHLAVSRLALRGGDGSQVVFGVAEPVVDLITLPAKARFGRLAYERAHYEVAAAILGVGLDVEAAWCRYVAAEQVAAMRVAAAEALGASAELAQRFYDAGNITELQLSREKAAASQARIEAARAAVAAQAAKLDLNLLIGLTGPDAAWTAEPSLPLPVDAEDDPAELRRIAETSNLDLLAARKGAEVAAGVARIARTFRLLGDTTVGVEREREADRSVIRGPALDLELPIFNQGGARVARADARLRLAQARLAELQLGSIDAVDLGAERVRALRAIVDVYREALVPAREAVARQSQLEQNFALIGEFEVLQARAQAYDAYEGLLLAIRDYWLARVDLSRLVGSRLPSDAQAKKPGPSPADLRTPPAGPTIDHSMHGGHEGHGTPEATSGPPPSEPQHPERQP